jgi:uncharacterized membrane protein
MKSGVEGYKAKEGLDFFLLIWIFMIGSFAGYLIETVCVSIEYGRFISMQGVIYGPFNQIYGFGAVLYAIFLQRVKERKLYVVFLESAFLGAAFEYLSSVFMEKVVGGACWDYSNTLFNINGRVSLEFTIAWGVIGAIFIKLIYPRICTKVRHLSKREYRIWAWIFLIFMAVNMSLTLGAQIRQKQRHENVEATNFIQKLFDVFYPDDPKVRYVE